MMCTVCVMSHSLANLSDFMITILQHMPYSITFHYAQSIPSPAGSTLHTLYGTLQHLMVSYPVVEV